LPVADSDDTGGDGRIAMAAEVTPTHVSHPSVLSMSSSRKVQLVFAYRKPFCSSGALPCGSDGERTVESRQTSIAVSGQTSFNDRTRGDHRVVATHRAWKILVAVLLAGLLIVSVQGATSTTVQGANPTGYTVVGTRIIGPSGGQFIPYGFVVECMSFRMPVNQLCTGNDPHTNQTGQAIVLAAGTTWNANVIRFQVAQENLFSGGHGAINPSYVALMDGLVSEANGLGMVAIMTLQERNQHGPVGPTSSSTQAIRR
jgi:hypothetical protein